MAHMKFNARTNGPTRLIADAALVFGPGEGPLGGMEIHGFALWRSPEGETFVTLPSRPFGAGTERRYFDLIRDPEGNGRAKELKAWILAQAVKEGVAAAPESAPRVGQGSWGGRGATGSPAPVAGS